MSEIAYQQLTSGTRYPDAIIRTLACPPAIGARLSPAGHSFPQARARFRKRERKTPTKGSG